MSRPIVANVPMRGAAKVIEPEPRGLAQPVQHSPESLSRDEDEGADDERGPHGTEGSRLEHADPAAERAADGHLNGARHSGDERQEDGCGAGRHGGEHNRIDSATKAEERLDSPL
jgi:hypothetical protein